MTERYWLVLPNGGRQQIDPDHFDLDAMAARAQRIGGRIVVEGGRTHDASEVQDRPPRGFEPPLSALVPLFRARLNRIRLCRENYDLDMSPRPTGRMLGGYYRKRRLVRVYTHDRLTGRRPLEELFDTFLHEIAHHLEYTEPESFEAESCQRVHGTMHSELFWRILGNLKARWARLQSS